MSSRLPALIFELAHQQGLFPLIWVALLAFRGRDPGVAYWWLAGVFAVSWLADSIAHYFNPWLVSPLYLVSQGTLIGFVFRTRKEAFLLTLALCVVAVAAVAWRGDSGPDVLLHTVAWLAIVGIVYPIWQLGRLRTSLLIYFGLGLLAWWGYAIVPGWSSWSICQFTRLAGILLFCWAATSPEPHLKLYRK